MDPKSKAYKEAYPMLDEPPVRRGVDRLLLSNIIRHVDSHNRRHEEDKMWSKFEQDKKRRAGDTDEEGSERDRISKRTPSATLSHERADSRPKQNLFSQALSGIGEQGSSSRGAPGPAGPAPPISHEDMPFEEEEYSEDDTESRRKRAKKEKRSKSKDKKKKKKKKKDSKSKDKEKSVSKTVTDRSEEAAFIGPCPPPPSHPTQSPTSPSLSSSSSSPSSPLSSPPRK